jgi:hypothetical protein
MKRILPVLLLGLGFSLTAQAVPWCHRGHITPVANITLAEWQLEDYRDNYLLPLPPYLVTQEDEDRYTASYAKEAVCSVYVGWNGPTFGVSNAGQVRAIAYAPSTYVSQIVGYSLNQGLSFRCEKCMPLRILRLDIDR